MADFQITSENLLETAEKKTADTDTHVKDEWQKAQDNVGKAILDQETYGQWFSLPSIAELLEKIGILKAVLSVIKEIMKILEECIKVINDIIALIEKLMGLILQFVNMYLVATLIFIRILKAKLQALLEALFASDLLGGGIYFTTFKVPYKRNTIFGQLQYEKTGAILREAVTEWPGHPEVDESSCGLLFIPYGTGFIPSFSALGETVEAFSDVWETTKSKYQDLASAKASADAYIKAKNDIEKFDGWYQELLYYVKMPVDKFVDRERELLDQTVFEGMTFDQVKTRIAQLSIQYKESMTSAAKSEVESKRNSILANYAINTRRMISNNKAFNTPFINSVVAYTDKDGNGKYDDYLEVFLTGDQNNFFMMHQVAINVINKESGELINEEPIIVFENPISTFLLNTKDAVDKLLGAINIKAIESFSVREIVDYSKFPFSLFEDEDLDSLAEFTSNETLLLMFMREKYFKDPSLKADDTRYINYLYTEPVDKSKENYSSEKDIPGLFFKSQVAGSIAGGKRLTYKSRWMVSKRKPITPYKFYIRLSDIKDEELVKKIKDSDTNRVSVSIATVNGECTILPEEFFDRNVSTYSLFSAGTPWDVGTPLCESSLAISSMFVSRPLKESPFGGEWVYYASPSASTDALMKYMLPPSVFEAIRRGREFVIDGLDYLEKLVEDLIDLANKANGLLDDVKSYLSLINNRVFKQIIALINSLLFDDIPTIYMAVWSGGSDRIPGFIMSALQEKNILKSTRGGVIFFGESAMLASILNIVRAGKDLKDFLEKNKEDVNKTENDIDISKITPDTFKGVVLLEYDALQPGSAETLPVYDAKKIVSDSIDNGINGAEDSLLGYDLTGEDVIDLNTNEKKLSLKYISVDEAIRVLNDLSFGNKAYSSNIRFRVNPRTLLS